MRLAIRSALIFNVLILFVCAPSALRAQEAKSGIFFIGDGMGPAQVTAGRIFKGNARDGKLTLDSLDHVAMVRTYAYDAMVTDSAASATALATGHKAKNRAISVDPKGNRLETILEKAKKQGKSVGVVTTTTVTHATPACFYAHGPNRGDEAGFAEQLIDDADIDLVMGGGRRYFLPRDRTDDERGGRGTRSDDRDLIAEAGGKGWRVIQRQSGFDQLLADIDAGRDPGKVLALFNYSHLEFELDRSKDPWGEPSLAEMTAAAIKILSRNPKGYFLMVEGGRIDHACHANQAYRAMTDLVAFDDAVKVGVDAARADGETLVVITADHETGGLAISAVGSLEVKGADLITGGSPFGSGSILTFASGPGADRAAQNRYAKDHPNYQQPALMKLRSAAHSGVDVILWADGPGAETFHGVLDNNEVGAKFMRAMGLE